MKEIIAIQGHEGSYSERAARQLNPEAEILYTDQFEKAFAAIDDGSADRGCLPFRNTRAGFIQYTYGWLTGHNTMSSYWTDGEVVLPIIHCVLANKGATIEGLREVKSQPEALRQCDRWLTEMNGQIRAVEGKDTALSAKEVSESGRQDFAAIAGRYAAELYGLQVLYEGIQDDQINLTRFVSVRRRDLAQRIDDKSNITSAILTLSDQGYGSLLRVLQVFADHEVNVRYINSRHIPNSPLYVDIVTELEIGLLDPRMRQIVAALAMLGTNITPTGNYTADTNHQKLAPVADTLRILFEKEALREYDGLISQFSN